MMPIYIKFILVLIFLCLVSQDDNVCAKGVRCMQRERQALLHLKGGFVDRYGMLSSWTTANRCLWKGIDGFIFLSEGLFGKDYVYIMYETFMTY